VLEVEFINDFIYQYYYITKSKYLNLMHSPSIETGLLYLGKIHPYRRVFP
ncbi:KTSC domain-containing protein, partial [Enterococcus faecium]